MLGLGSRALTATVCIPYKYFCIYIYVYIWCIYIYIYIYLDSLFGLRTTRRMKDNNPACALVRKYDFVLGGVFLSKPETASSTAFWSKTVLLKTTNPLKGLGSWVPPPPPHTKKKNVLGAKAKRDHALISTMFYHETFTRPGFRV